MVKDRKTVHLSLTVSPELNERLEELAALGYTSKSEILSKAIALFDIVAQAKADRLRVGILDGDKRLLTEIVGL